MTLGFRPMRPSGRCAALAATVAVLPAPSAFARDMMGPDWVQMLTWFPMLVLYAIGEFALFLVPCLLAMAVVTAVLRRAGLKLADHVPASSTLVVLALFAAVPGGIYWMKTSDDPPDPARAPRVIASREKKVAPPVGKSWPRTTGYLDLPRSAEGGPGIVLVSARASMYDTYLKLCEVGQQPCRGLRHAYLRKGEEFHFRGLQEGEYELRYLFIARPIVGGRSRPIRISGYMEDPHEIRIDDSPVLETPRNPIVGIYAKDF